MLRTATPRRRPGFTLIELMVAAAVAVLIMSILATAFSLGIDTMRQMRAAGEMMDQLRGAENAMKADLRAYHILDANGNPRKLSSFRWDQVKVDDIGTPKGDPPYYVINGWEGPVNGFVRFASSPLSYPGSGEQTDADNLSTASATVLTHYLHFTSILPQSNDDDYYRATVGGATYHSSAAEIAYFLEQDPISTFGVPTFRLIRRQRLVSLNDTDRRDRPWPQAADHAVIGLRQPSNTQVYLNTLGEITQPSNRLGGAQWNASGTQVGPGYALLNNKSPYSPKDDALQLMQTRPGEDVLLSNVLSFEVSAIYKSAAFDAKLPNTPKVLDRTFGLGVSKPSSVTSAGTTTEWPFDALPPVSALANPALGGTNTFDSWSNAFAGWVNRLDPATGVFTPGPDVPPLLVRVQAVQIRIRVWDQKLQTGRQITIVQDL